MIPFTYTSVFALGITCVDVPAFRCSSYLSLNIIIRCLIFGAHETTLSTKRHPSEFSQESRSFWYLDLSKVMNGTSYCGITYGNSIPKRLESHQRSFLLQIKPPLENDEWNIYGNSISKRLNDTKDTPPQKQGLPQRSVMIFLKDGFIHRSRYMDVYMPLCNRPTTMRSLPPARDQCKTRT